MKRSRSVALTLMVGTAALALAGCGDGGQTASEGPSTTDYAFSGPDQCISSGKDPEGCSATFQRALLAHNARAPRYPTESECEDATDADCESATFQNVDGTAATAWVPKMDGFMFTEADGEWQTGDQSGGTAVASSGSGGVRHHYYYSSPLYSSRSHPGARVDLTSMRAFSSATPQARLTTPRAYVSNLGVQRSAYKAASGPSTRVSSGSSGGGSVFGNVRSSSTSRGGFVSSGRGGGSFGG